MEKGFVRALIKDSALTSVGAAFTVFFHFLSIVILSRYLGKNPLGLYFLIMAVCHVLTVISGLGLDLTLVKFLSAEGSGEPGQAFWPILTIRLILGGFLVTGLALGGESLAAIINTEMTDYVFLMAVIFFLGSMRDLLYHTLQGLRRFRAYAVIQTSSAFLRVLLIVGLIWFGTFTLRSLFWIEMVVPLFCILTQVPAIRFHHLGAFEAHRLRWKDALRFGFPLYLNNLLTVIIDRANVFLMGGLLSLEGVAIYEISGKIPAGLLRILRSFILVYFPNLSHLVSKEAKEDVQQLIQQALTFSSLLISFLALGVFLFRESIMAMVFSEVYAKAGLFLFLMMINLLLRMLTNLMGYAVVSAGYASAPVKANSLSSLLLVTGSLCLIPLLGVTGAIVSLLIMNVASQGMFYRYLLASGVRVNLAGPLRPFLIAMFLCGVYSALRPSSLFLGWWPIVIKLLYLGGYGLGCRLWVKEVGTVVSLGSRLVRRPRTSS